MEISRNTILIVHMPIAFVIADRTTYCHKLQFTAAVLKLLMAYKGRLYPSIVPNEKEKPR
jgi:hypothetical protein